MKIIKIVLQIKQYMCDIVSALLTNTIYLKVLPGIRATSLELDTLRHSIIIQANVPVIRGKKKSPHSKNKFCGVYEGIGVDDIIDYLMDDRVKYKKIMVTPESFIKVKSATEAFKINMHEEFFLLFDECDRTMKDVAFRKNILLPMDDFFKFKNKAFISATAVMPSDPRFVEQGFEMVVIEPDYNYSKDIELIVSNNVSLSLKDLISKNAGNTVCVFLNSIKAITSVIEDLQIKDHAHVYCSKERMLQLKSVGYKSFDMVSDNYSNINFFTSRFNSAVDMLMDVKPIVILATNLHFAHHTMIDPRSEAVQIVGRFRNGVESIYALTNIDEGLKFRNGEEALSYLDGCKESYDTLKTLYKSTANEGARATLGEALELVTYSAFVNDDGSTNYFMVDNFLYEESVKKIFQSKENFVDAYRSKYFNPTEREDEYQIKDEDYKVANSGVSIRELVSIVVNTIKKATENRFLYQIDNRDVVLKELEKCFPLIYSAYYILGEEELLNSSWSKKQIQKAVKKKIELNDKRNFSFIEDLNEAFDDNYKATSDVIKAKLRILIEKHNLNLKPEIKLLREYFNLSPRTSIKLNPDVKGYRILSSKFKRKIDTKS